MSTEKKTFNQFSESLANLTLKKPTRAEIANDNSTSEPKNELEGLLAQLNEQSTAIKSIVPPILSKRELNSSQIVLDSKQIVNDGPSNNIEYPKTENDNQTNINENDNKNKLKMTRKILQMESVQIKDDLINDNTQFKAKEEANFTNENKQKKPENNNKTNKIVDEKHETPKANKIEKEHNQIKNDSNKIDQKQSSTTKHNLHHDSGAVFSVNDSLKSSIIFQKDNTSKTLTKNEEKEGTNKNIIAKDLNDQSFSIQNKKNKPNKINQLQNKSNPSIANNDQQQKNKVSKTKQLPQKKEDIIPKEKLFESTIKKKHNRLNKSSSAKQIKEVTKESDEDKDEELNKTQTKQKDKQIMINSFFPSSSGTVITKIDNELTYKPQLSSTNMIEEDIEEIIELSPKIKDDSNQEKFVKETVSKKTIKENSKSQEKKKIKDKGSTISKQNTANSIKKQNHSEKELKQSSLNDKKKIIDKSEDDNLISSKKPKTEQNQKMKIEQIVKNIMEFDVNHPKIKNSKYSFISSYFSKKKHSLDLIINNKSNQIEGFGIYRQRRNCFLESIYYTNQFDDKNSFDILAKETMETYFTSLCEKYKNIQTDIENLRKESNSTKYIFDKKSTNKNTLIGNVENISTFYYKYSLHERWDILKSSMNTFEYWRQVYNDGNSFYRVIMFLLLESLILNKEIDYLMIIYKEILALKDSYHYEKIDYEKALIIFRLIIDFVSKKKDKNAHDLLIKAFNNSKNDVFDQVVVIYLKITAIEYLKKTYRLIEKKEKDNNNSNEMIRNVSLYFNNNIDPDINLLSIVQYLFNINIEVCWLDGLFDNPQFGTLKYLSKHNSKEQFKPIKIIIGFFFSSYYVLYSNDNQIDSDILNDIISACTNSFTQLTYKESSKNKCSRCGRLSSLIFFLQKEFNACVECLKEHIESVMNERAQSFIQCNFIGLECIIILIIYLNYF